jgi:nucleotide-binding universal stress UspA family protein
MTDPTASAGAPILVAVDFSPGSEAAMRWAVDTAADLRAPLQVLHVVHDPADAPGYYRNAPEGRIEALEEAAGDMLVEFVDAARSELPRMSELRDLESSVVVGLPVTRILEVAERSGARMIVMGGQGRTRLSDRLLGSKVERVARLASTPVTIVKQPPDEATTP